jgi:tetratricopeptide (TPR) repeat protein
MAAADGGDVRAAEAYFRQVTKLNPRAAAAHAQLARLELTRGKAADAVTAATQAAAIVPDDPTVAIVLARSLRASGDLARASEYLAARISKQPKVSAFHSELGWVRLSQRKFVEAAASFAAALQIDARSSEAQDGLTAVDLATSHAAAARARVMEWLGRDPENTHLKLLSARIDLVSGNPDAAVRTLQQLVISNPRELDAYSLLGGVYTRRGQIADALAQYRAVAAQSKTPGGAMTMVGLLEEARGNRSTAQTSYEKALAADAENGTAANNLAWIYAADGRLEEALRLATDAERLLPKRPEPKDTLGWIKYQEARYWEAGQLFQQAVSAAPDRPTYQYHLGLARMQDGRSDEARRLLQRAVDLGLTGPDADRATEALRQLSGS